MIAIRAPLGTYLPLCPVHPPTHPPAIHYSPPPPPPHLTADVSAPDPRHVSGTTLEVPDPDEGMENGERKYQIQLVSHNGPIDIYLVHAPPAAVRILRPHALSPTTQLVIVNALLSHVT